MPKLPSSLSQRIVQITAIPESDDHSFMVFALTADGEIFSNVWDLTATPPDWEGWQPVPPISQTPPIPGTRR